MLNHLKSLGIGLGIFAGLYALVALIFYVPIIFCIIAVLVLSFGIGTFVRKVWE